MVTKDLAAAFGLMSKKIADQANREIQANMKQLDKSAALMDRIRRMIEQRNVSLLSAFTGAWKPFKPDLSGQYGIKIKIRQMDAQSLDTPAVRDQMRQITRDAAEQVIMHDPKSFIQPLLQDYFNNKDPYLIREDATTGAKVPKKKMPPKPPSPPSGQQKLF